MNEQTAIKKHKAAESARFSQEQVEEVLELLEGSDSLELKLMLDDSAREAVRRVGFDPVEAEARQVYFFDTPTLALNKAGLIVRARRSPRGKGDTVVKLRPVDPETVDADLKRDESFKVELDAMPGGFVCSASAKGRCTAQEVYDVSQGQIPLSSILSREQKEFFAAHAPDGLTLDGLVPLGPTFLLRIKHQPKKFDRPIVVELWLYPDGSRILEISVKGTADEAFQLAAKFRAFVRSEGIELGDQGATKTKSAMAYFARQMKAKAVRG